MSLLVGKCKKCDGVIKIEMGSLSQSQIRDKLSKLDSFSCCNHVELTSPVPHYWDIDHFKMMDDSLPTEKEFLDDLKSKYSDVRNTAAMAPLITGFSYGFPLTNDGNDDWTFTHSPGGTRYYYRGKRGG